MFPILPLLILFLLGPANAERLAVEGRLPPALLAVHRSMVEPLRATFSATIEQDSRETDKTSSPHRPQFVYAVDLRAPEFSFDVTIPNCPPRAGPRSA